MGKLAFLVMLVIGGTIAVIARMIIKQIASSSASLTINKIRKNPAHAQEIADELNIPMSVKENFSKSDFQFLKTYLETGRTIANYQILYNMELNASQILVLTKVTFTDYGVTVTGKPSDVNRTDYLNFVLTQDPVKNTLTICSDIFNSANEKLLKQGFLSAVLTGQESL